MANLSRSISVFGYAFPFYKCSLIFSFMASSEAVSSIILSGMTPSSSRARAYTLVLGNPSIIQCLHSFSQAVIFFLTTSITMSSGTKTKLILGNDNYRKLTVSALLLCCLDFFTLWSILSCFFAQEVARLYECQVELVLQTFRVLFALASGWAEEEDSFHCYRK